ncbi:hypothetical protein NEISUBOT_04966 [Neisseria subflava NJ9703]|uniref:Uncharacterized protein n=1 Tax=Neisseria subflava NJ9703 TaxID=546268 RepID=A0A9W5MYX3_NEISU|nr:hypothetical protein NEISUBOT_04966 [Neisseria subflava NJ9703]DAK41923.1 MAG TPA: hypothetical protein [Caudoviricetes sp.]
MPYSIPSEKTFTFFYLIKKILYHQNDKKIYRHIHKFSMLICCLYAVYPMPFE